MPKTLDDAAIVNLVGASIDETADKFHVWDDSVGQDKYVTLNDLITRIAALQGFFGRTPDYDSGEQSVTVNTTLTLAHSLGALPRKVDLIMRCKTADGGRAIGDEIPINGMSQNGADNGFMLIVNSTNVIVEQGAAIRILNTSHNGASITTTSWRWVVRAWK